MNQSVSMSVMRHKKLTIAMAIACGFLLVLPSCGIPPLRPPKPGPGLPESFDLRKADPKSDLPEIFDHADSPDNSALLRVEEFYNDPALTDMVYQALGGNQELRVMSENVQIASNEIMSRQGAYLPFVFLGTGSSIDKYSQYTLDGAAIRSDEFAPGRLLPNPLPNFFYGPTLFWTPDIWRQLHNAKDAAAMRYYAAAEGRNFFVTQIVAQIAENYYQLMALDKRIEILDQTIALQEQSLSAAKSIKEGARGTELPVQRFLAEVRRNQSEKLIVQQEMIEAENRINFLLGRNPQHIDRVAGDFIDLQLHDLSMGVPAQLLRNRPDIRQAEREIGAAGLDVLVARKRFYPQGFINAGIGFNAFDPRYLFLSPEALVANAIGNLIVPFINKKAIRADYMSADARQLQALYNYQRVVLNAFIEVVNRLSKVENYRNSIEIKKKQLAALEESVRIAMSLFQYARADYVDVLFAQRDLRDARTVTVETKQQQLTAIVETYQALGGGSYLLPIPVPKPLQPHHARWKFWKHPQGSGAAANVAPVPPGGAPLALAPASERPELLPPLPPGVNAAEPTTPPMTDGGPKPPPPPPPAANAPGPAAPPASNGGLISPLSPEGLNPEPLPPIRTGRSSDRLPVPADEKTP